MNTPLKNTLIKNLAELCERMVRRMESWKDELANPSSIGFRDDLRRITEEYPKHEDACNRLRNLMDDLKGYTEEEGWRIAVATMIEDGQVMRNRRYEKTDRYKMSHLTTFLIADVLISTLKECNLDAPTEDRKIINFFAGRNIL